MIIVKKGNRNKEESKYECASILLYEEKNERSL